MGCDIHTFIEVKRNGKWRFCPEPVFTWWDGKHTFRPFKDRNYEVFAFLADVRNYGMVTPIFQPRGLPSDCSEFVRLESEDRGPDGHSHSWVSLEELLKQDYDKIIWNRRVTRQITPTFTDGGCTTDDPNEGMRVSLREYLGSEFFKDIIAIQKRIFVKDYCEEIRIVFWFDN